MKLRGGGDLFGTRQHGRAPFHAARLPRALPVLSRAREAAQALIAADPGLEAPEHRLLAAAVRRREHLMEESSASVESGTAQRP